MTKTEDVVALAEALIADGSSDLRPDYLAAALNVCLSRCDLALIPQSLSERIDVLEGARKTANELWIMMIERGILIGGEHIVVRVNDSNELIAAIRRTSLTEGIAPNVRSGHISPCAKEGAGGRLAPAWPKGTTGASQSQRGGSF